MRDPNFGDDGMLREITRIEFNVMEFGRFQRNIWSGDVLVESEVGRPEDVDEFFGSAALLVLSPEDDEMTDDNNWNVSPQITFRLDQELRDAVEKYCRKHKVESASQLAREALAEKVGRPELGRMRRPGRPKIEAED